MIYIVFLFVLFLVGVPICFSLGLVSISGIVAGGFPLTVAVQRMFTGADSTALIAIPLFILAGIDWSPSQRFGSGKHFGVYVLCCHYWFCHCGYRCYRRHYDSHHGEKGI